MAFVYSVTLGQMVVSLSQLELTAYINVSYADTVIGIIYFVCKKALTDKELHLLYKCYIVILLGVSRA